MIPIHSLPAAELERFFDDRLAEFSEGDASHSCFVCSYSFPQYYFDQAPELPLLACVALVRDNKKIVAWCGVVAATDEIIAKIQSLPAGADALREFVRGSGAAWIDLLQPLQLKPVAIAKPWGQEIWYTGIEARGQSLVESFDGCGETLLPWVLSFAPKRLASGLEKSLCLLKVLDPLPDEVYGDLYFEMHEEKREVYVVTNVDETAWPGGIGGIRFGFDQTRRAELGDKVFKAAYQQAVAAYQKIRIEIDACFDVRRKEANIAVNEPLDAHTLKSWQALLPEPLQQKELQLRREMESFTAIKPLQLGDVVKVPCFTPHSLLHGVRTIEFQTPVYERKILSFAQKVLTQSGWDTDQALPLMSLDSPESEPLRVLHQSEGCLIEQVVRFDDFEVFRISLDAGANYDLQKFVSTAPYVLGLSVVGEVELGSHLLMLDRAYLLAQAWIEAEGGHLVVSSSESAAVLLLARPV